MELYELLEHLSGYQDHGLGGQRDPVARDFLALRWLCSLLYEETLRPASWTAVIGRDLTEVLQAHSPGLTSATLVTPPSAGDASAYPEILAKTTLYSDFVVTVMPIALKALETSYPAAGPADSARIGIR